MTTEIERKYLLRSAPDLEVMRAEVGDLQVSEIEQRYLAAPPGVERRVRRRTDGDVVECVRTEKRSIEGTRVERLETEETITLAEYLADAVETLGSPIMKRRHVFVHEGQRFELDQFSSPIDAWLLEIELTNTSDDVRLPHFLDIDREVTDDPAWRNAAIASSGTDLGHQRSLDDPE